MKQYRVYLDGRSLTASYDNLLVEVMAEDEDDAVRRAKHKLTRPGGTFFDWSPSMFEVRRVERGF